MMISDTALWTTVGAMAATVALVATLADRRRTRRSDFDAVGFMPWPGIFVIALLVACAAIGLAAKAWLAG